MVSDSNFRLKVQLHSVRDTANPIPSVGDAAKRASINRRRLVHPAGTQERRSETSITTRVIKEEPLELVG